jgi:hypothetical protein
VHALLRHTGVIDDSSTFESAHAFEHLSDVLLKLPFKLVTNGGRHARSIRSKYLTE